MPVLQMLVHFYSYSYNYEAKIMCGTVLLENFIDYFIDLDIVFFEGRAAWIVDARATM